MLSEKNAFTLIELLVVILIISVLVAVAMSQYQKTVEKTKATQAITFVQALSQAANVYLLGNGAFPTHINQLDIDLTEEQKQSFLCTDISQTCNKSDWGIALYRSTVQDYGIAVWRTSGKYKGCGFSMYQMLSDKSKERFYKENTLYCLERTAGPNTVTIQPGEYCQKLFNGMQFDPGIHNAKEYQLPF